MKVVIEVVADEREDVVALVREAAGILKRSKEESGVTQSYCLGDYRVIVTEEAEVEPPFVKGERVVYTGPVPSRNGKSAMVRHSGPLYSGVVFDDGHVEIYGNKVLAREGLKDRMLGEVLSSPSATCPCGTPGCPTGPECFGGSDYP